MNDRTLEAVEREREREREREYTFTRAKQMLSRK